MTRIQAKELKSIHIQAKYGTVRELRWDLVQLGGEKGERLRHRNLTIETYLLAREE